MSENLKKYKKLAIFDLDGTLISTPLPEDGKKIWLEQTGTPWPHEGWWGKKESLDMDIFEMETIKEVIDDYEKHKQIPDVCMVLLTGRMSKLGDLVREIVRAKGLEFHEYHFNNGGSTEQSKIRTMDELLFKYPEVEEVFCWDDRLAHIPIFEAWGKEQCLSGRLKDFKITVVTNEGRDGKH